MRNLHNLSSVRTDEINAIIFYYEAGPERLWHVIYKDGKPFIRYSEANVMTKEDRELRAVHAGTIKEAMRYWKLEGSPIIPHDNK